MVAKYQDVREITVTVEHGNEYGATMFEHGLQDADGNSLVPDTIICEIVDHSGISLFPATVESIRPPGIAGMNIPDGNVAVIVTKAQNTTEQNQVYTIRVTCIRWHSIQGSDHSA